MTVDRNKLLDAAVRVYGEFGFRGATTRRIADEAGVNEITIFRQFGSKEALINEAIRTHAVRSWPTELPATPLDPQRELAAWCGGVLAHLTDARSLIRRTMSEMEERRDIAPCVADGPTHAARHLRSYVERLRQLGFMATHAGRDEDNGDGTALPLGRNAAPNGRNPPRRDTVEVAQGHSTEHSEVLVQAAVSMLMSALFADAMGRDMMPAMYPQPAEEVSAVYVTLFLRALGVRSPALPPPAKCQGRGPT